MNLNNYTRTILSLSLNFKRCKVKTVSNIKALIIDNQKKKFNQFDQKKFQIGQKGVFKKYFDFLKNVDNRKKDSGDRESFKENRNSDDNNEKNYKDRNVNYKIYQFNGNQLIKIFFLTLGCTILTYIFLKINENQTEISFQDFKINYLQKGLVNNLIVYNKHSVKANLIHDYVAPNNTKKDFVTFTIGSVQFFEQEMKKVQDKLEIPLSERIKISYKSQNNYLNYLTPILPTVLLIFGLWYISAKKVSSISSSEGQRNIFGIGKSKAKLFNQENNVKVRFKDIAGCEDSKNEIVEFVKFLQNPAKYQKLGAKIPRGAILSGLPGTGKTLLAKATAGEAGVPFLSVSGSEFVEMFVGVGSSRVRDLFKTATQMAPSIIFIDEIDAIGKKRGNGKLSSNDEKENTLNQLLVEMDGFDSSNNVVVLAGTNRIDVLDEALLRPGRFDRHIIIDLPELEDRKSIFKIYLRKLKLKVFEDLKKEKDESLSDYEQAQFNLIDDLSSRLSALTPGFSGADISNCCNEGALMAARCNSEYIEPEHFEMAIERSIAGLEKKSRILSKEEKKVVSYHEAGHAICGWFLEHSDPLLKVSIIPRGKSALGYAQYLPKDQNLVTQEEFFHKMIMILGGRVSEELHFDSVTTGASDDFKRITQMAQLMVLKFGMSQKLGHVYYHDENENTLKVHHSYSEHTSKLIDSEIKRFVDEAYQKCVELLKNKKHLIEKVANELYEKEVLVRNDLKKILGERPFKEKNNAFLKHINGEDAFKHNKKTSIDDQKKLDDIN